MIISILNWIRQYLNIYICFDNKGDEFALRDEQFLYCKIDNDALEKGAPADIKTIAIDIKQTINTSNSDSSELESKSGNIWSLISSIVVVRMWIQNVWLVSLNSLLFTIYL